MPLVITTFLTLLGHRVSKPNMGVLLLSYMPNPASRGLFRGCGGDIRLGHRVLEHDFKLPTFEGFLSVLINGFASSGVCLYIEGVARTRQLTL